MSRIKEFYHDQIVEGARQVVVEPYLFRYFAHFKYNGEEYNLFGDSLKRIVELAEQAIPEIHGVRMSKNPDEFEFLTQYANIPFLVFELTNPRY